MFGQSSRFGFLFRERSAEKSFEWKEHGIAPKVNQQQNRRDEDDKKYGEIISCLLGMKSGRDEQSDNRTAEMGIVTNISAIVLFHSIERIQDEANRVDPGWNGNGQVEHLDFPAWEKQHVSEDNTANAARCAVCLIDVMPMNVERKQTAADDRAEINSQEFRPAVDELNELGETIQADHVQDQVGPAGMQKGRGDEAIEFFASEYGFGVENVFLLEREALEAQIRYPDRQADNQVSADWRCSKHSDLLLRSSVWPVLTTRQQFIGK